MDTDRLIQNAQQYSPKRDYAPHLDVTWPMFQALDEDLQARITEAAAGAAGYDELIITATASGDGSSAPYDFFTPGDGGYEFEIFMQSLGTAGSGTIQVDVDQAGGLSPVTVAASPCLGADGVTDRSGASYGWDKNFLLASGGPVTATVTISSFSGSPVDYRIVLRAYKVT